MKKPTASDLAKTLNTQPRGKQQDHQASVAAIRRGYEDALAGRTRPATEFLDELRKRYGFPCVMGPTR